MRDYRGNLGILVIFSGGQDSTTLALLSKQFFNKTELLSFDYGQNHAIELKQAKKIAKKLDLSYKIIKLKFLKELVTSDLIGGESLDASASTMVPNRNALFLTLAHTYAQKKGLGTIALGAASDDYNFYPDCREEFIKIQEQALNIGSSGQISIIAPLLGINKEIEFALADLLGELNLILEHTHTCYNGSRAQNDFGRGCGVCNACILRKNAWISFCKNREINMQKAKIFMENFKKISKISEVGDK
ncbi:MAG: 7-cyano-7-deazaguanine synthase QueC [Helicobacter sp.]|nr:7-cyano-7-deazaguanine synthase QueC [Helicobacter sp.]